MKQRDNEQGMNYWKKEIMKKEGMIERKGWWMDEDRERERRKKHPMASGWFSGSTHDTK